MLLQQGDQIVRILPIAHGLKCNNIGILLCNVKLNNATAARLCMFEMKSDLSTEEAEKWTPCLAAVKYEYLNTPQVDHCYIVAEWKVKSHLFY